MDDRVFSRLPGTGAGAAGSLAGWFAKPLLPNEPRILNRDVEQALTERYLLPALAELECFLLAVRRRVDAVLQPAQPVKAGKPYPLGQCLEISQEVHAVLRVFDPSCLDLMAARGHAAFTAFLDAGGTFRQVWGDLRGEFFQNAFQLGTLYVDVSNDTVTPTKPKVEIQPFVKARFVPVADFRHFSRIASRYWQHRVFPNHVLPEIAPYCPLVHVTPAGGVVIMDVTDYMLAMAQAALFYPSEDVLRDKPMPDDLFRFAAKTLADSKWKVARSANEGRAEALRHCRSYRDKRRHLSSKHTAQVGATVFEANRRLAAASALSRTFAIEAPGSTGSAPIQPSERNTMHQYNVVSAARHAGKRWRRHGGFHFAAADVTVPLTAQELPKAVMSLPVGFAMNGSHLVPVAILGATDGKSPFVGTDGRWLGGYIPAAYRSYPFACADSTDGQYVVCIDENSELLSDSDGEPMFAENGELTEGLKEMVRFLTEQKQNELQTRQICTILQEHQLIQPWPIRAGVRNVTGLFRIDEAALNRLSAPAFEEVRQAGALPVAYCQLLSMQHLPQAGCSNIQ